MATFRTAQDNLQNGRLCDATICPRHLYLAAMLILENLKGCRTDKAGLLLTVPEDQGTRSLLTTY
jgi:hypothetical protein